MGWRDVFKDSITAALRNRGDISGTLRDFNAERSQAEYRTRMLARVASLGMDLEAQRIKALAWQAKRLAEGHSVNIETTHQTCTLFGGHMAIIRFHRGGEVGLVEAFYGGFGSPMGPGHGHIVIRHGEMDFWRTEEPNAIVLVNR